MKSTNKRQSKELSTERNKSLQAVSELNALKENVEKEKQKLTKASNELKTITNKCKTIQMERDQLKEVFDTQIATINELTNDSGEKQKRIQERYVCAVTQPFFLFCGIELTCLP